jgi:hypothetical protein
MRDLLELGLLQVEYTNEPDPDFIGALLMDYIAGWADGLWEPDAV